MSPRSEEVMESESVDVTDNNNKNNKRTSPAVRDASDNELDIDQDNNIESDNGSSAHRPKRARKTSTDGVCDDSGLTEDDRRILRRNQRRLHDIIRNDKREEVLQQGDELDFLEKVRQRNNELFQDVKYTREAVLDAENVHLVAQKYVQQVDRLVQVPRYDPVKLVHKLVQKCTLQANGSSVFDWRTLGSECGICFNALPERVSFLAGPLDVPAPAEKKARVVRQRAKPEAGPEVQPDQVQLGDKTQDAADKLSATEKTMKRMVKKLLKRSQEESGGHVDGVQYLFNPDSFTQTVENIFHFSFLIKKGEAAIGVRGGTPPLQDAADDTDQAAGAQGLFVKPTKSPMNQPSRQAVVAFSMRDWRALCQGYALEKGDLPHRTGSKFTNAGGADASQEFE